MIPGTTVVPARRILDVVHVVGTRRTVPRMCGARRNDVREFLRPCRRPPSHREPCDDVFEPATSTTACGLPMDNDELWVAWTPAADDVMCPRCTGTAHEEPTLL